MGSYSKNCFLGYCPLCRKPMFHQDVCSKQANAVGGCSRCPDKIACRDHSNSELDCKCNHYNVIQALQMKIFDLEAERNFIIRRYDHEQIHYLSNRTKDKHN